MIMYKNKIWKNDKLPLIGKILEIDDEITLLHSVKSSNFINYDAFYSKRPCCASYNALIISNRSQYSSFFLQ